jgi:hypothetical protein
MNSTKKGNRSVEQKLENKTKIHENKFQRLRASRSSNGAARVQENLEKSAIISAPGVVNLSTEMFTDEKMNNLLDKSLQLSPPTKNLPLFDIIVNIESAIQYLPDSYQSSIRTESKEAIIQAKSISQKRRNTQENGVIRSLNIKNYFYIKADKSNIVVILDKIEYDDRMENMITNGPFPKLDNNPLREMGDSTKNIINHVVVTLELPSYIYIYEI